MHAWQVHAHRSNGIALPSLLTPKPVKCPDAVSVHAVGWKPLPVWGSLASSAPSGGKLHHHLPERSRDQLSLGLVTGRWLSDNKADHKPSDPEVCPRK